MRLSKNCIAFCNKFNKFNDTEGRKKVSECDQEIPQSHTADQPMQGSKIPLVGSYLRVPQAAGQVKLLTFLMKIKYFPIYSNTFCDAGQVLILRYFEACHGSVRKSHMTFTVTRHLQDNKSKATSFLFIFKMIAKLEWT